MPAGLWELAIQGGISVVLAMVVIYWNRQDTQRRVEDAKAREGEAKERERQQRDDKLLLIDQLRQNTEIKMRLINTIDGNSEAIDELRREISGINKGRPYE